MGLSTAHTSPSRQKEDTPLSVAEYLTRHRAGLSKADFEYLTRADHEKQLYPRVEYEAEQPYLEIAVGGHLVTVKPERPAGMSSVSGGGIRGGVSEFSRASRRRLTRLIAGTEKAAMPLFVTLTYPDLFSQDKQDWKRDLDVIGKRIRRNFEETGFVWRIEFTERRSGQNEGAIAPHFHLLLWGIDAYTFRNYIGPAWYETVGSGDERHARAGTNVQQVRKWNGVMSYASKYIAKEQRYPLDWSGRVWGAVGRDKIPFAPILRIALDINSSIRLVRLGRKYLGLIGKVLTFGLTWLMDGETVLDYLEVLLGFR